MIKFIIRILYPLCEASASYACENKLGLWLFLSLLLKNDIKQLPEKSSW